MSMINAPEWAISLTLEDIEDGFLSDLGVSLPRADPFLAGLENEDLASGHTLVSGYGLAVWRYSFLNRTERDILKAFCTGDSAEVYIRTLNELNEWQTMLVIMTWQNGENFEDDLSLDLVISFKVLQTFEDA